MDPYADSPSDTLIFLDIRLVLLDLSASRVVDLLHAHVLFTPTELGCINSNEETFDPACLSVLHILLGDFTVAVDIELNEELLVVRLSINDVVERT